MKDHTILIAGESNLAAAIAGDFLTSEDPPKVGLLGTQYSPIQNFIDEYKDSGLLTCAYANISGKSNVSFAISQIKKQTGRIDSLVLIPSLSRVTSCIPSPASLKNEIEFCKTIMRKLMRHDQVSRALLILPQCHYKTQQGFCIQNPDVERLNVQIKAFKPLEAEYTPVVNTIITPPIKGVDKGVPRKVKTVDLKKLLKLVRLGTCDDSIPINGHTLWISDYPH